MMLIVCIAGLFGNIAAILVFGKPHRLQKNFYSFMFYLSFFDLTYTIVCLLVFVFPQLSNFYKHDGPWHYVVPWAIPIGQISMTGSVYFTMVITIERYLTVCHPFYMFSRNWHSRPIVIGIIIFAVAYNIPKFLEISTKYEYCTFTKTFSEELNVFKFSSEPCEVEIRSRIPISETRYSKDRNDTLIDDQNFDKNQTLTVELYTIQASEMRLNSLYVQIYAVYLNFFINGVGPFTVIILLNLLILNQLQKSELYLSPSRQHRGRKEILQKNHVNTPKLLMLV